MKIFYTSTTNGIDQELDQPCPFKQKGKSGGFIYVGSVSCKECKYCYGYGQHPNQLHKLIVIPFYSRNTKENMYKTDSELPEYSLKDCKFVSETDYVKCMKCYNDYGKQMRKNRFKLWYWKNIGEHLSNLRCNLIEKYYDTKFFIKSKLVWHNF